MGKIHTTLAKELVSVEHVFEETSEGNDFRRFTSHHDELETNTSLSKMRQQDNSVSEDTVELPANIGPLVPLQKKCSVMKSIKYESIMNKLEELQSQSKWEEHKRLTSFYLTSSKEQDLKIVLNLEQGMAEILQKKIPVAKKRFRSALQLCDKSNNVTVLKGRALMFLGNAYRKEGPAKYGKALDCLTLAQQNLSLVEPGEDRAELNYFFGALYLNLLSISRREPSQNSRDRIEQYYERVYEFAMFDSASRVHEKIQRIFPLGMVNFLLDCQTEVARSRLVPYAKIKRAEDSLNHFLDLFPFDEQPVSMQTDFCKSKSDLEYRKGNFQESEKFLQQGLDIARIHNYSLEVQSLEKRLEMLQKCMPRVPFPLPQESDTGAIADRSAFETTDLNVFSSGSD